MKKMITAALVAATVLAPIASEASTTKSGLVAGTATAISAGAATASTAISQLGLYTIATNGGVALASTLPGASAAGTVGIIGGTSGGVVAATVAALSGPVGWSIAGVSAAVALGFGFYATHSK